MAHVLITSRIRGKQNTLSKTNNSSDPFFGRVYTAGDGKNKTDEIKL